ncbi:hypothetical protein R2601_03093 [Salipiger bermudensis HTCC2601]|uniref:Uncharacterized protein n=1 Tax=Salipiger bermudensis (strain DSM 26914 / JCM 13377 / KCTC 12554 / HTCC2601) TaxID=314265 RepID=Q0FWM7_SALBH|nr:hypothetical protein R2601_03093 [Salipiger bermudensis HTCC2601]
MRWWRRASASASAPAVKTSEACEISDIGSAPLVAGIEDPLLRGPEGHEGQRHDDEEKHPRDGRGIAHVEALEGLVVDVERQQVGGFERPALGDDVGAVELLEGLDHLHDQVEEDHRRDQRNGDEDEAAQLARPVDGGGLVERLVDALKRGEEDHHGRTELPAAQKGDGEERVGGIAEPVDRLDPEPCQHHVHQPLGGEDVAPQHRDGDRAAEDRGHVEGGAKEVDAAQLVVEDVGDEERESEFQRHRQEHVEQRHRERPAEGSVRGEELDIVLQPRPFRGLHQVVTGKAQIE